MKPEGVGDVTDVNTLVSLQVALARIEETLKPLAALVPSVAEVRDTSKEALACAQQVKDKLTALEPEWASTREMAETALRKAEEALEVQREQAEGRKWMKRAFYGVIIASSASGLVAAVWAGFKLAAMK
ncbi:hypothetical protein JJQ72_06330 [Paenibacillus sp. F411]|uniref:hypothetical protein n=1 Tax=Paenibacillus sp. F411 TaxID=2820239 RepID=UPI001AAE5E44|nr:hypothetical protein [Paenibacillus sp. F411]MBO2943594.1 hypothetical protein [Paenibacillus sp. F411]